MQLLGALVAVLPLWCTLTATAPFLPGALHFVVAKGWWLAAAGVSAMLLRCAFPAFRTAPSIGRAAAGFLRVRRAWPVVFTAAFLIAILSLPSWRRSGGASGDEPKYLRIACSVYRDLDTDVSSNRQGPLTARGLWKNIEGLARSTQDTVGSLLRGEEPDRAHTWNLGNWTVAAWRGGRYHVQGPGLPALLAPFVGWQAAEDVIPPLAFAVLACLFALAFVQTAALAVEVSGLRPEGVMAAACVVFSPAVFVCGYHVYPEAAVVAAVPWLARHARDGGPPLRPARWWAVAFVAGTLVWFHVKFAVLGLVVVVLVARRLGTRATPAFAAIAAVPVAGWLLYQYRLTGLLRPDALYVRFGDALWSGVDTDRRWLFASGLANGLFGSRDGVFLMVPVAAVAALGVPWLWRRDRSATVVVGALFASVWAAAALHGGGAPGPPARLLSPAAPLLAVPLSLALSRLRHLLGFRWSLAAAVLVSLAIITTMGSSWRRTVNPYRDLAGAAEFRKDLPGAHADARGAAADLARAGILLIGVGFWPWRFRPAALAPTASAPSGAEPPVRPRATALREAVAFQAVGWLTLALVAMALHAVTVLAGG
jgi:hypothetical protein